LDCTAAIAIPAIRRQAALDDTVRDTRSGLRRHRAYQPGYRQMVARMCRRGL